MPATGGSSDLNGATPEAPLPPGVGAVPLNINGGTRVGPGGAFLQPAMRRTNLTLLANTRVGRVRIAERPGGRRGLRRPRRAVDLTADRIVLCAGAIGSAHLLMLSGVGPRRGLRPAGVSVHADLPVGIACVDHPEWVLPVHWSPTHGLPPLEAVLTTSDGLEIRPYTAGFGAMITGRRDDPADRPHIGVTLMRPRSRGRVALASADPAVPPIIEHRYDSEPDDVAALRAGAELARELAARDSAKSARCRGRHRSTCRGTAPMGATMTRAPWSIRSAVCAASTDCGWSTGRSCR